MGVFLDERGPGGGGEGGWDTSILESMFSQEC